MTLILPAYQRPWSWATIKPVSPVQMALDFERKPREWYHVLLHVDDFQLVIRQAFIKWYSVCYCRLDTKKHPVVVKDDDESTYRWVDVGFFKREDGYTFERHKVAAQPQHIHALLHFSQGASLAEFESYLTRVGKQLHRETVFQTTICLDQAVGVLAGLSCSNGEEICTIPFHLRDARKVFDKTWIHAKRNGRCAIVRAKVSESAALGVKDLSKYSSPLELHVKESCLCPRGLLC